jgi:iron complex transport system ATP-binding protein
MARMSNLIELRNITAYRGDTLVFDDFSLVLERGRNTVILGPNGAGKTTLLKLLTREIYPVYRPQSRLRILGQEEWNVWELRAHLGLVSHDLQRDYVGYACGRDVVLSGFYSSVGTWGHQQFSAAQQARAARVLDDLDIAHLQTKLFAQMSTGEQRRCLLGRALVNDPHSLILDEPTSGLDLHACFHYLDGIRDLMQRGKTVVLVTHHIHEIPPEIADVVLLRAGRVVARGAKQALLTSANLSDLYGVPIELVQANGWYQALPAGRR